MGKKFLSLPKPKNKQIQGQLTHSGLKDLLKSFHFHVIEIVFVEMDWVEVGKKEKSKLVKNVFIELEKKALFRAWSLS